MTLLSRPHLLIVDGPGRAASPRRSAEGYPPYDVERFPATADRDEFYRITIAVAGFRTEDLEVVAAADELVVRGRQTEEPPRTYLHRGIAARRFQKSFRIGDGVTVLGAEHGDGLLSIDLARPRGPKPVRTVPIATPAGRIESKE